MKIKIEIDFKSLKIGSFLKDFVATYQKAIYRGFRFLIKHWIKSLIILLVFVLLALLVNFTAAFFWSLFLAFLIMRLDNRIFIAAALICLIICPFLLLFKYQLWSEQVAVWAYYFLALGVILQIIEFILEPQEDLGKAEESELSTQPEKEAVFLHHHKKEAKSMSKSKRFAFILTAVTLSVTVLTVGGIILLRKYILVSNPQPTEVIIPQENNLLRNEEEKMPDKSLITITILNGNGIPGAAARLKTDLENKGFKVKAIGDADRQDYPETVIRYQPGADEKAKLLAETLKDKYTVRSEETTIPQETEIVIIVGIR